MSDYPPSAFYFKVEFFSPYGKGDTSFQEVSGIGAEIETEEVAEGGDQYVHRLPKSIKYPRLVLKRGIATINSPLVKWCKSVLEAGFISSIVVLPLLVFLMNEDKVPIRAWSFANAYPVKWDIDAFNSTKNEVAIETIELSYTNSQRLV